KELSSCRSRSHFPPRMFQSTPANPPESIADRANSPRTMLQRNPNRHYLEASAYPYPKGYQLHMFIVARLKKQKRHSRAKLEIEPEPQLQPQKIPFRAGGDFHVVSEESSAISWNPCSVCLGVTPAAFAQHYTQTNLVSSIPGLGTNPANP